ncbi:MAG: hypothetical protein MdMp014T_0371 [Treponematales bacterium]
MAVTSTERVKRYRARKRELKVEIAALFPGYPITKETREKLEALGYRQVIAWAKPETLTQIGLSLKIRRIGKPKSLTRNSRRSFRMSRRNVSDAAVIVRAGKAM